MGKRPPGAGHEGFVPLDAACARVYWAVTGHGSHAAKAGQWESQLDSVAFSLCMVARIYATDPLTSALVPLSEAEVIRGRFTGGAGAFVLSGKARQSGLHIALADLEDAIHVLSTTAKTQRLPPPRP
jgi:hypothetical protein